MIEFGKTLIAAREAKGLTTRQIAEKTHMMVQMVENLENENFAKIAAPIYGRGFVKLYCEAVGIDPKPMIAEFMDIYNGNREPIIHTREVSEPNTVGTAAPCRPEMVGTAAPCRPDSKPPQISIDLFNAPTPAKAAGNPCHPYQAPVPAPAVTAPLQKPSLSRYAAPQPIIDDAPKFPKFKVSIPPSLWRLIVLVCAAALILWLIFAGTRALYNATMSPKEATPENAPAKESVKTPAKTQPPTGERKPMTLPALYID